jgi:hypothetical protein
MKNYIKKAITFLLMLSLVTSFVFVNNDSASATTIIVYSYLEKVVSDGNGGAFLLIQNFDEKSVYIQHLDSSGNSTWHGSGTSVPFSYLCDFVYDRQDSVICVWEDNNRLYVNKIDSYGNSVWEDNGILVYQDTQESEWDVSGDLLVVADNNGGAILIWQCRGDGYALYAQKIDNNGEICWDVNGILVAQKNEEKYCLDCYIDITGTHDGMGGAIIAWKEMHWKEQEQMTVTSIFSQRLDKQGHICWGVKGLQFEPEYQHYKLTSDGNGGAFFILDDYDDVFFCHINRTGERVSGVNDIKLDHTAFLYDLQILPDGVGGFFIVREEQYRGWNFLRDDPDLYAQRIDSMGNNLWGEKRIAICTNGSNQSDLSIVTDGSGGFIVAWQDYDGHSRYIFTQRVDASGNVLWDKDGINLGRYYYPYRDFEMVANGSGGAIIVREEGESLEPRIFSQVVDNNGVFTEPETSLYPPGLPRDRQDYEALIGSTTIYYAPERSIWVWLAPLTVFLVILVIFFIVRRKRRNKHLNHYLE